MNLDEAIARTKEASESQRLGELGRETALQFAAWLEELKQYKEENQPETNLDHFKHEILENCLWSLAVAKGKPTRCDLISCSDCEFSKDRPKGCHEKAMKWLKQPCKAPAIKLTKFEIDLLQSYLKSSLLSGYEFKSIAILKRMKGKGYFKDVDEDATIEDILADCDIKEED